MQMTTFSSGQPCPHTIIPDRSQPEISTYVVQGGDTIFDIAAKFGLAPETIMWANSTVEDNPDWLQLGQELIILPVDGVYHQIGGGRHHRQHRRGLQSRTGRHCGVPPQ